MNIFVGNLSFAATEADVKSLFEGFGNVLSVTIVKEKKGVKSRGFGFVEMPDEHQAQAAITALEAKEFMGRPLNVSTARPKSEKIQKDHREKRFNPVFKRMGRYKQGRRSRSFIMRRAAEGIEVKPQRKIIKENPMRWRKKDKQEKPWKKKQEFGFSGEKAKSQFKPQWLKKKSSGKWRKGNKERRIG